MTSPDEELDAETSDALRSYNTPPAAPLQSLWQAIERAEEHTAGGSEVSPLSRWWLAAAAALLMFVSGVGAGYALGRTSATDVADWRSVPAVLPARSDSVLQVAWF